MKSRNWVFTSFNEQTPDSELNAKYIAYAQETCPTTDKKHWQGFVALANAMTMSALKKKVNWHLEAMKGNIQQNVDYCSKQGKLIEFGEKPSQGKRTDIMMIRDEIAAGHGMRDMVDMVTSYQSLKCAEAMLKYKENKREWKTEVVWYWGPTGTGKTKTAFAEATDPWISAKSLKWWEGYDAHEHVIIDDFRTDFCTFYELLRILDRYPYRVEVKGGTRQLLAKKIWVTSPFKPEECYRYEAEQIDQLLRRIDEVRYFGTEVDCTEVGGNTRPRLLTRCERQDFEDAVCDYGSD